MTITRVGPLSCAKVAGLLYVVIGLIAGGLFSLFSMAGAAIGAGCWQRRRRDVRRALRRRRDHPAADLLRLLRLRGDADHGRAVQCRRGHGGRRRG